MRNKVMFVSSQSWRHWFFLINSVATVIVWLELLFAGRSTSRVSTTRRPVSTPSLPMTTSTSSSGESETSTKVRDKYHTNTLQQRFHSRRFSTRNCSLHHFHFTSYVMHIFLFRYPILTPVESWLVFTCLGE